ncbi:MAG: OsmC family protein [Promethearchaeota archaeon]
MYEYNVKVNWEKDADVPYKRMGTLTSDDFPPITVVTPPEFKHGIPGDWGPEQLYVASAAVCIMTTFLQISEGSGLEYESFRVEARGVLEEWQEGGADKREITSIHQKFYLKLSNPKQVKKAERVVEKSDENCLVANSMKTKVTTELILE